MSAIRYPVRIAIAAILAACALLGAAAQSFLKREEAVRVADEVADDVVKHYYDPKLHGVDWNAQVSDTKKKIASGTSGSLTYANIAAMLDSLNDSHTYFIPGNSFGFDYGWRIQIIGERCFVTRVRPGTDAAGKVHPGDEVLDINGYKPTPANMIRIEYVLYTLRPQAEIEATLRSVSGEERQVEIFSKLLPPVYVNTSTQLRDALESEHKRVEPRTVSLNDDVLVAKIPMFAFDERDADKVSGPARKHKSVILDLRGNPGGTAESVRLLVSKFFDREVKIADVVGREGAKPLIAKPDRHAFSGKLTVLVDSRSTGSAELFARVVQLEKRGSVIGDHTPGMVMEAKEYGLFSPGHSFAVSVTVANMIMTDGNSLEHVGVMPDELALPTTDDIANERDPVLAHAAELAGAKLSPKDAAALFPYEWR